jgi:hypothetical protein
MVSRHVNDPEKQHFEEPEGLPGPDRMRPSGNAAGIDDGGEPFF